MLRRRLGGAGRACVGWACVPCCSALIAGLECQPLRLEQVCRRALAVADQCCEHDRAVELAPPALACRRRRIVDDAQQIGIRRRLGQLSRRYAVLVAAEMARHVGCEPHQVDVGGAKHGTGIRVVGKRQQQVLERHRAVRLGARVIGRFRQRRRKALRFRHEAHRLGERLRHPALLWRWLSSWPLRLPSRS